MLPKKVIVKVVDIATGGLVSLTKAIVISGFESNINEKIEDFYKKLLDNQITIDEIEKYIEDMTSFQKDIFYTIIQKVLISETPLKRFLLVKIWLYQMKNEKLDYFHSTLFNNIDLFIFHDYEMIYDILQNQDQAIIQENQLIIKESKSAINDFQFTISKLESIGLIDDTSKYIHDIVNKTKEANKYYPTHRDAIYQITPSFKILNEYINSFFGGNA